MQDIPLIEANNSDQPIFRAASKEGEIRLDDTTLIKLCEYARESSIVIVSVNTRVNNIEENIGDAYIEAALGRKKFLLVLTPYPEIYMRSSVVLF